MKKSKPVINILIFIIAIFFMFACGGDGNVSGKNTGNSSSTNNSATYTANNDYWLCSIHYTIYFPDIQNSNDNYYIITIYEEDQIVENIYYDEDELTTENTNDKDRWVANKYQSSHTGYLHSDYSDWTYIKFVIKHSASNLTWSSGWYPIGKGDEQTVIELTPEFEKNGEK